MPPSTKSRAGSSMEIDSMLARLDRDTEPVGSHPPPPPAADPPVRNPSATLPPGTPLRKIERPDEHPAAAHADAGARDPLALVLAEVRAVRLLQEEILGLLRGRSEPRRAEATPSRHASEEHAGFADRPHEGGLVPGFDALDEVLDEPPAPPVRTRRNKRVLIIDDDARTREEAVAALDQAQIPVRTVSDGNAGLAAIAAERPDVIVLELDIRGSMAGKDVVNMIKATMEWVDIPIVLYTRAAIASQKDARTIHGADEFVVKGPTGAETLVATIVSTFRRA